MTDIGEVYIYKLTCVGTEHLSLFGETTKYPVPDNFYSGSLEDVQNVANKHYEEYRFDSESELEWCEVEHGVWFGYDWRELEIYEIVGIRAMNAKNH